MWTKELRAPTPTTPEMPHLHSSRLVCQQLAELANGVPMLGDAAKMADEVWGAAILVIAGSAKTFAR
jgi:hypothetical protein